MSEASKLIARENDRCRTALGWLCTVVRNCAIDTYKRLAEIKLKALDEFNYCHFTKHWI